MEKTKDVRDTRILEKGVYEFLVFNRGGQQLYRVDFCKNESLPIEHRLKLIFGLIWSLKSFSKLVHGKQKNETVDGVGR